MKHTYTSLMAAALTVVCLMFSGMEAWGSYKLEAVRPHSSLSTEIPNLVSGLKKSRNMGRLEKPVGSDMKKEAPAPLGGNFSDWELLGTGTFNAELGLVDPCPVNVYYCTTDPYGMGVDSWAIEGVFEGQYIRVAGMPFIDYYNIGQVDTQCTHEGKQVSVDEISTHYSIGVETSYDETLGLFSLAMLYYVDDPDDPDNVVAYGIETVQLDGDFKDYRVSLEVAGEKKDDGSLKTVVDYVDASNVKTQIYQGEYGLDEIGYPSDELQTLIEAQDADESIPVMEKPGVVTFQMKDEATYTVLTTYHAGGEEPEYKVGFYTYEARWSDCGTADFTDDYLASYYDDFPILTATGLKLQKQDGLERYRILNPFTTDRTWLDTWSRLQPYDEEVNSFFVINSINPEQTYIEINPSDITDGDGIRLVVGSAAHYNIINGIPEENITARGYWGVTEYTEDKSEITVSFPEMTLMMRPISQDWPMFAGYHGEFKVVMHIDGSGLNIVNKDFDNAPVEYFDLQGVRVAKPTTGLYLRRQGDKTTKVFVK